MDIKEFLTHNVNQEKFDSLASDPDEDLDNNSDAHAEANNNQSAVVIARDFPDDRLLAGEALDKVNHTEPKPVPRKVVEPTPVQSKRLVNTPTPANRRNAFSRQSFEAQPLRTALVRRSASSGVTF